MALHPVVFTFVFIFDFGTPKAVTPSIFLDYDDEYDDEDRFNPSFEPLKQVHAPVLCNSRDGCRSKNYHRTHDGASRDADGRIFTVQRQENGRGKDPENCKKADLKIIFTIRLLISSQINISNT
uniref:Secreted protein n=1 Tax=Romanomermis culicivorax TaxID=13658 RepID=A0A915KB10_ROMCU